MNYVKTMELLAQQADKKAIPLEYVMEVMRTYLTEVRHQTGASVEKCPINDMEQLIASLAAVTSDINFVFRRNEKTILGNEGLYTQSLVKAQNTCGEYAGKITALDETIAALRNQQAQMQLLLKQLEARDAETARLKKETALLRAQIDALRTDTPDSDAAKLQQQIEQQQKTLAHLQEEYKQAQIDSNALNQSIGGQQSKLSTAAQDLLNLKEKLQKLEKEVNAAEQLNSTFATQIKQYSNTNTALQQQNQAAQLTINGLQQNHATLQQNHTNLQSQLSMLQNSCTQLQKQIAALQQQLTAETQTRNNLQTKQKTLTQNISQVQADITQGKQAIQNAQTRLDTEKKTAEELVRKQVETEMALQNQIDDNNDFRTNHLSKVQQEYQAALQAYEAMKQQLQDLKDKKQQHENDRSLLAGEITLQKIKTETAEKLLQQTQTQLDTQKQKVNTLEKDVRVTAAEYEALLDREKKLQELLDEKNIAQVREEITSNIQALEKSIAQAEEDEQEAARLRKQVKEQKEKLDKCRTDLEKCRADVAAISTEYSDIKRQLDEATAPENVQRCQKLSRELEQLRLIHKRLGDINRQPCGGRFDAAKDVLNNMAWAEHAAAEMRGAMQNYIARRQKSLETP